MIEQTSERSARLRARRNTSIHGPMISPPLALLVTDLFALAGLGAFAGQADHVPGRILVQPKPGVPEGVLQALVASHGARNAST